MAPIITIPLILHAHASIQSSCPSLLDDCTLTRVGVLMVGFVCLGLGVGAPCLGGGHPSLTPTYSQVWAFSDVPSQIRFGFLVLGF